MTILISNDDGIQSPGIQLLAKSLQASGHDVFVVAPASDRSAVGHSLTLHKPLRVSEVSKNMFAVTGSPADCVYWATRHLLKNQRPDLVLSGINKGANLGHDIFYSGTVAAAREGALFGIKSCAISLCTLPYSTSHKPFWETAANFVLNLVPKIMTLNYPISTTVFNVNVPDVTAEEIRGIRLSEQGTRLYSDDVTEGTDPRGKKYYWIGGTYKGFKDIPGSDCQNVHEKFISITPLNINTTNGQILKEIKDWETLSIK